MIKKIGAAVLAALSKPQVQDKLVEALRTAVVEKLIVGVLKLSGIKAWLLTLLADKVIDEADEHLVEPLFREIGYTGDVLQGAVIYKKVKNAQDVDDWLDSVGDV